MHILDFSVLKSAVTMEMVLNHTNVKLRKRCNSLVGCCPIHHGDNNTAFNVSLSKNLWVCFTHCHCGGSVIDFVIHMEGLSNDSAGARQAALPLHRWFNPSTEYPKPLSHPPHNNKPLPFALHNSIPPTPTCKSAGSIPLSPIISVSDSTTNQESCPAGSSFPFTTMKEDWWRMPVEQ